MLWLLLILTSHPLVDNSTGKLTEHAKRNGFLDVVAQEHADDMAKREHQDHNGFFNKDGTGRYADVKKVIDCKEVSEICAESWEGQDQEAASKDAWKSWKKSKSHWKTANGKASEYGVGMAKGANGIWYSTIIATWCG
jgi:uncharacterized protein YkwD